MSESSAELKPAAKAFLEQVRAKIVDLVKVSLASYGDVEGAVYDEVFGEGYDRSTVPGYLPVVSYFQVGVVMTRQLGDANVHAITSMRACRVCMPCMHAVHACLAWGRLHRCAA